MFPAISAVLTVVLLNIQVFWDVTLCHLYSSRTTCRTTRASYTRRLETSLFPHLKLFWFSWCKILFLQYGNFLIFKVTKNGCHECQNIETKTSPTLPLISLTQRIYITWSLVYKWLLRNLLSVISQHFFCHFDHRPTQWQFKMLYIIRENFYKICNNISATPDLSDSVLKLNTHSVSKIYASWVQAAAKFIISDVLVSTDL